MEIIYVEEKGRLFGSTKAIGIGKRKPELIYGKKAKELRENAKLSIEDLANNFKMKSFDIERIEEQKQALTDKVYEKYKKEFGVDREYFFDLDLETLLVTLEGHVIKTFETSEECLKTFKEIQEAYNNALKEKCNLKLDFETMTFELVK